jgi:4-hydroxy-4-methyl-2-oxoglutarate aldolase
MFHSTESLVSRLAAVDTCALSDALDRLGIPGVALGLFAVSAGRRIAGVATTVQLDTEDGHASKRHLCTAAVDAAGPGHVIVIAHGGRTDVAGWGGMLSKGARRNGVEGIVIDGACRDVDESRELDLSIYAKACVPITARGRIVEVAWNVPVYIAGIQVSPGDLILADASGVVFVPLARAEEAIGVAEAIVRKERLMADQVDSGKAMTEVMGINYEAMLSADA